MIAEFFSSLVPAAPAPVDRVRAFAGNSILENPAYSLTDPAAYEFMDAGVVSDAGLRVTHKNALALPAFFQAISMLSGDAAAVPRNIYEKLPDGDREIDLQHAAEFLIADEWNDETPAFEGWRRIVAHAHIWGNGYAWIDRRGKQGPPNGLWNLLPDRTRPFRQASGEIAYVSEVDGRPEPLFKEEVLHLKGPLTLQNGLGLDLVNAAKNCIGLALAAEGFSSKFFANGAQTAGVLTIPPGLSENAAQQLEDGFRRRTSKDNWFKVLIARDGAKFEATTIEAQKAQLHELREDQVRDVARLFNLPGFKLNLRDSVAYNSSEMAQLMYLQSALSHILLSIKGECQLKLLTRDQRRKRTHYIGHNVQAWIELDVKTHREILEIERRNEIISANEWRRDTNRNRRTDPGGDEYVNPNTKSVVPGASGSGGGADEPIDPDDPAAKRKNPKQPKVTPAATPPAASSAHRELLAESINRAARRVSFSAKSAARKPAKFQNWIDAAAVEILPAFNEIARLPVAAYCSALGGESAPMLISIGSQFTAAAIDRLKPLLEAPYAAADLETNVAAACLDFESKIATSLLEPYTVNQ